MPRVARLNIAPVRSLGLETRDEIDSRARRCRRGPPLLRDRRRRPPGRPADSRRDGPGRVVDGPGGHEAAPDLPGRHGRRGRGPPRRRDRDRHPRPDRGGTHRRRTVGRGTLGLPRSRGPDRPLRSVGGTRSAHPATLVSDGSIEALGAVLGVGDLDCAAVPDADRARGRQRARRGHLGRLSDRPRRVDPADQRAGRPLRDDHPRPETGERDYDTLRAIKEYRGQVDGKDLMFGVLGEVERPGRHPSRRRGPRPRLSHDRLRPSRPAARVAVSGRPRRRTSSTQTTDAERDQRRDPDRGGDPGPQAARRPRPRRRRVLPPCRPARPG